MSGKTGYFVGKIGEVLTVGYNPPRILVGARQLGNDFATSIISHPTASPLREEKDQVTYIV
ncbi:MAG TPA: hypothetical protein PLD25_12370 [Chloroflexota bacterium]|nr:hypothetical protein [Chloroflexota bacterium]HUM70365.1 hypothetical protein [Chloroflexota bacterium]